MTESTQPDPSEKTPQEAAQGPSQALKAFAARLEQGPAPDLDDLSEVLLDAEGFSLDQTHRALLIEATEKVANGIAPDPLALRMLAKAVASSGTAVAEAPPRRRGRPPGSKNKSKAADALDGRDHDRIAAPPTPWPGSNPLKRSEESFGTPPTDEEDAEILAALRVAPTNGKIAVVDESEDEPPYPYGADHPDPNYPDPDSAEELLEPESEVDLVVRAAEMIEKIDGNLAGSLYTLADRLSRQPLLEVERADLVERTRAAVAKEIKKALDTGSPLPVYAVEWLKMQAI